MAQPVDASMRSSSGPVPEQWPKQAADTVERVVGQVRDRTTKPALTIARAIVYGLFAAIVGTLAAVLSGVLVVRILETYVPGKVWIIYLAIGAVLTICGLLAWRKAFAASTGS